jgi:hypothetical protein
VTSIGGSAFSNCKSLTSVYIPKEVAYIGSSAVYLHFEDSSDLTIYCEANTKPKGWDSDWNVWMIRIPNTLQGYETRHVVVRDFDMNNL